MADAAQVWGILNLTPDSFSDGGAFVRTDGDRETVDVEVAVAHGRRLIEEGASVLDVGGESTRPGHQNVSLERELCRVLPVIEALSTFATVSIDTQKGEVARQAIVAGAKFVNDVSGGRDDTLLGAVAAGGVDIVLMHNRARGQKKCGQYDL